MEVNVTRLWSLVNTSAANVTEAVAGAGSSGGLPENALLAADGRGLETADGRVLVAW